MAAAQDYQFSILHNTVTVSSWRQLLFWLGPPGLALAAVALLTLDEPRKPPGSFLGDVFSSSKFTSAANLNRGQRSRSPSPPPRTGAAAASAPAKPAPDAKDDSEGLWNRVRTLIGSPVFQVSIAFRREDELREQN